MSLGGELLLPALPIKTLIVSVDVAGLEAGRSQETRKHPTYILLQHGLLSPAGEQRCHQFAAGTPVTGSKYHFNTHIFSRWLTAKLTEFTRY